MVQFHVTYTGEQQEPSLVEIDTENGHLRLVTLLTEAKLAYAREVSSGRLISTDIQGTVVDLNLTTASPLKITGLRYLRSMSMKEVLERPSGSGHAIFEGRFMSTGTTEVARYPSRAIRFKLGPIVQSWYQTLTDTPQLEEMICSPFLNDGRLAALPYLSETACNAAFFTMVLSPINEILTRLRLDYRWHQEPNQQRTSEIGVVSIGRPDFNLLENHQNRRRGSVEGKMPWILHQGHTGVTEEERQVIYHERSERPYRVDPNELPADLVALYNGTRARTSVRSALGQEAGYMESDDHVLGFLTSDSVLYMLVQHPNYRGTVFLSEDFGWMSTLVTQRMVLLYGTLVLLGEVSPDELLAAAASAFAQDVRPCQAPGGLEGHSSAGPRSSSGNASGPAFWTRSRSANSRKRRSDGEEDADVTAAKQGAGTGSKSLHPSCLSKLQLVETICDGHAGRVYEGRLLGRPVIVKSADTAYSSVGKKLLMNEAAIAMTLAPLWEKAVPSLLASGYLGPSFFVNVFQKIEGRTPRLKEKGKALMALRQVHKLGVLHGDVKVENFIITSDGRIFIFDFGLSRLCSDLAALREEELELR